MRKPEKLWSRTLCKVNQYGRTEIYAVSSWNKKHLIATLPRPSFEPEKTGETQNGGTD